MIQRVQTLWLLLASGCAFATFKFPFYSGAKGVVPDVKLLANENFLIMLTTIVVGGLALVNIFLFKKRPVQLFLCVLGILLEAVLIFLYYQEVQKFNPGGTYSLTAILHSIIVFAFFLAARGIRKDQKVVKESDRLR